MHRKIYFTYFAKYFLKNVKSTFYMQNINLRFISET